MPIINHNNITNNCESSIRHISKCYYSQIRSRTPIVRRNKTKYSFPPVHHSTLNNKNNAMHILNKV